MGLTKEEKKAKKEAAKLEKLRLEVELKKQLRRDELSREMAFQARKKAALDKSMREMMLKLKEPLFKQDIEIMWHTFERIYDNKDNLITHTMKLIDVAEDQFQRTVASFCDTIDTMINKFLQDLENMSKENTNKTAALLNWGNEIKNKIMTDNNAAELHLQLLLFHGHTTADNYAWNTRGENMVKEDEERKKFADIREDLTSFLENNYNAMWDEYKAVLKAYVMATADNQKQARKLRRKQNLMADIIASQGKKIASSDGILRRLRTELLAYESGTKQQAFRDRRDRHRAACARLKNCFLTGCATDERRLAVVVRCSDDALEWLEKSYKKGKKILKVAALCRKFETRREKVLPFGSDTPLETAQPKPTTRRQTIAEDSLIVGAMNTCAGLQRLWQRVAKAELMKKALLREKNILERENAMIIQEIAEIRERQRLSGKKNTTDVTVCICETEKSPQPQPIQPTVIRRPVAVDGALDIKKYGRRYM